MNGPQIMLLLFTPVLLGFVGFMVRQGAIGIVGAIAATGAILATVTVLALSQ